MATTQRPFDIHEMRRVIETHFIVPLFNGVWNMLEDERKNPPPTYVHYRASSGRCTYISPDNFFLGRPSLAHQ